MRGWPFLGAVLVFAALPAAIAAGATLEIKVVSVTVSTVSHDIGPKGASKGDTILYRDKLVNATPQFGKKAGAEIGSDSGTMTFTGAHTATFNGKAILPRGTLTLSGSVYSSPQGLVVPVTGGTGAYAHYKGTLLVGSGSKRVANTYRLARPSGPVA
jgi:hypothetical protein